MKYLILLSALFLTACSSTSGVNIGDTMNLIAQSEDSAPNGVQGTFRFRIKASGIRKGEVFLNTELDYRDRRAITILLSPNIISEFTKRYGSPPDVYFVGKQIEVKGEAKRAKIYFFSRGRKTEKYYFQTHIKVSSVGQIKVLG